MRGYATTVLSLVALMAADATPADEVVNLVHVRCSVSDNSLTITHFHVINDEAPPQHVKALPEILSQAKVQFGEEVYYNPRMTEVVAEIPDKMVARAPISHVCELPSGSTRLVLAYNAISVSGMCGVSPGARLTVHGDEKLLFKDVGFDNDCTSHVSVHRATYKDGNWEFCGGGFDTEDLEYCVEPKDYSAKAIDVALRKKRDELLKRSQ